jgi:hypothetical protein
MDAKCDCQHCGGHISFPEEAAGQMVECPLCKVETLLFISPEPSLLKPPNQNTFALYFALCLIVFLFILGIVVIFTSLGNRAL